MRLASLLVGTAVGLCACGDDEGTTTAAGGGGSTSSTTSSGSTGSGSTTSSSAGGGTPGSTTTASTGAGAGGGGGGGTYRLGGTVTGLEGSLVLSSGADEVVLTQDGPFELASGLPDGATFDVVVEGEPGLSRCKVEGGSGAIDGADALDVEVRCARRLLFWANDGVTGQAMWITDGTPEGTSLLADLDPEDVALGGGGDVEVIHLGNGVAVFSGDDGVTGRELWRTDGTPEGTSLLADIFDGSSSSPSDLRRVDDRAYFVASSAGDGPQLWWTDGEETEQLIDLSALGYIHRLLGVVSDRFVLRMVTDGGLRVVATDGTQEGTQVLTPTAISDSNPVQSVELDGFVHFTWFEDEERPSIWRTDATLLGTGEVFESLIVDSGSAAITDLVAFDGQLWFSAANPFNGREPHVSEDGSSRLWDVTPGQASSYPRNFFPLAGGAVFRTSPKEGDVGIWLASADGRPIAFPGPHGTRSQLHRILDGQLLYSTNLGGTTILTTDGTDAGTTPLIDLGISSNGVHSFIGDALGAAVFFAHQDGLGYEPFVTDGTPAGTMLLGDLCPGEGDSL